MTWYTQIINKNTFFEHLFQLDKEEFEKKHKTICPFCNQGKLHDASYLRKPRGFNGNLKNDINIRFSLCCSNEKCRRRYNPLSLRFFDKKVYFSVFIILITCLRYGESTYSLKRLNKVFGVSTRTVLRWRKYWLYKFQDREIYRKLCGYLNYQFKKFPEDLLALLVKTHGEEQNTIILLLKNLSRPPPKVNNYSSI